MSLILLPDVSIDGEAVLEQIGDEQEGATVSKL